MRFFRVAVVVVSLASLQFSGCGGEKVVDQPQEATTSPEDAENMAEQMRAATEQPDGGAAPATN